MKLHGLVPVGTSKPTSQAKLVFAVMESISALLITSFVAQLTGEHPCQQKKSKDVLSPRNAKSIVALVVGAYQDILVQPECLLDILLQITSFLKKQFNFSLMNFSVIEVLYS